MSFIKKIFNLELHETDNMLFTEKKTKYSDRHIEYLIPSGDIELVEKLQLKKFNAIVAGGAALCWYQNLPVKYNDVDLWFQQRIDLDRMIAFCNAEFTLVFDSVNASTYEYATTNKTYKIQLIKRLYNDIPTLLESFDISVCQVATDGKYWYHGKNFAQDLKNSVLRIDGKNHREIVKRMMKYWVYGYAPSDQLLLSLVDEEDISFNFVNSGGSEYENLLF